MKLFIQLFALALVVTLGLAAQANQTEQATFARTFPFPVSSFQKVEQSMQAAASRTGQDMQKEIDYQIDSNFTLRCAEESPTMYEGHLYGCVLATTVDVDGTMITLQNLMYMTQTTAEVNDVLAKTDSTKTKTVELKTPFDGGHGSRYFCNAEGSPSAWGCYLYFVD